MQDRSPNATKEEMQITIDLLRGRGDAAIEMLDTLIASSEEQNRKIRAYRAKLAEVDERLGIQPQDRKDNAVLIARRMLGKLGEGKSDEEIIAMIGAKNG